MEIALLFPVQIPLDGFAETCSRIVSKQGTRVNATAGTRQLPTLKYFSLVLSPAISAIARFARTATVWSSLPAEKR